MGWGHVAAFIGVVACLLAGCGVQGESGAPTAAEEPTVTEDGTVAEDATAPPPYGGRENIAPNASFEDEIEGWKPWGLNGKVEAVVTKAKDGRAAAKVSAKSIAPYGIEAEPLIGYPEFGDRYTLSAWLRSGDAPKTVVLRIVENGGRFDSQSVAERRVRLSTQWEEFSISGTIRRADRENVNVYMYVLRSIRRGDTFFVDAVTFLRKPRGGA